MSKDQRASELERRRQCRQNMCKEQSLTSTANTDGVSRKFAQLYILDTAEATSKRLAMPENQDCSERLMININNLMHEINELTKSYKMLHEVEKEAQSEAAAKGIAPTEDCCGYSGSFFIPDEFLESSFKLFRFPILAITRKLKLLFAWTWAVCCGDFAPP
ncbi:hypothetical protein QTO34_014307 [Cnephaeus nilssonii]|uniref:Uncharacterized protein n=1 Tax=Cnephaeus nilssonii TaxID=3371016 RepID=A0AA40LU66_CNENI|nr:hypothetical protein QTO34_014307 [Eptesicus nilssonii]